MKETIMNNIKDMSDSGEFSFVIPCTVCGKTWVSTPVPFSRADGIMKREVKKILFCKNYHQEKKQAIEIAVKEAGRKLNFCPVCKSLVCDDCFRICEHEDMCIDCALYFHEKGERIE